MIVKMWDGLEGRNCSILTVRKVFDEDGVGNKEKELHVWDLYRDDNAHDSELRW